jgi:uncharacterized protein (DUF4415 family)
MKKEYDVKKLRKRPNPPTTSPDSTVPKTFRMPLDILQWLEREGEKDGVGYQTKMIMILRRAMSAEPESKLISAEEIRAIVRDELAKKVG